MKIKSIKIVGMHNADNKTYEFDDVSYLHGPNGSGKSTVLQAIQLALLGYVPISGKQKDATFRHANSNIMNVELTIQKDDGTETKITRTWMKSKNEIKPAFDYAIEPSDLLGNAELPLFNYDEFMSLTANKMKDWFIDFLPSSVTEINWDEVLQTEEYTLHKNELDETFIQDNVSDIKGFHLSGADEIRKANEHFKSALSFKKKELERLQSTVQTMIFYDDVDTSLSVDDIDSKISELSTKKSELNYLKGKIEKNDSIKLRLAEYADLTSDSAENDTKYIELKDKLEKLSEKSNESADEINKLDQSKSELLSNRSEILNKISEYKFDIKQLTGLADVCPFTSKSCQTLSELHSEYDEKRKSIEVSLAEAESNLKAIDTKLSDIDNKKKRIADTVRSISDDAYLIKNSMNKITDSYERKSFLESQVEDIEYVTDVSVEELDVKLKELQDTKMKMFANEKYNSMIDSLTASKYKLEFEIEVYKSWITLTGVNGLQSNDDFSKPFESLADNMNDVISTLFNENVSCMFKIEAKANSFSFGLNRNGSYIPYTQLSSGEKCVYTLALLISLVRLSSSKLKLVMIDDFIDHLDDTHVSNLFDSLNKIEDVQFILAGVKSCDKSFVIEVGE